MMFTIDALKGLSSEEIAKIVHKGQLYGDGSDYYDGHIALVKSKGIELAQLYHLSNIDIDIVGKLCDLHDAPEDTELNGKQIAELFGEELGADAESLNIYHLDGTKKTKDEYYSQISLKVVRKITKAADRYLNIIKIPQTLDKDRALWWYKKYSEDHKYYLKYDIFPDLFEGPLNLARESLVKKGRL